MPSSPLIEKLFSCR